MNVSQAIGEVMAITGRPDKTGETLRALNYVIAYFTMKANFYKDLVETSFPVDSALYGDTIQFNNLTTAPLVTRFRKFKYVKPAGVLRNLRCISPEHIFTPGNTMQKDVYFVAGDNLTYILNSKTDSLVVGYYQYAPTLEVTDTHWMLDMLPSAVIDKTAARIFRSIGDDESAKHYETSGEELYKTARKDFEDGADPEAR